MDGELAARAREDDARADALRHALDEAVVTLRCADGAAEASRRRSARGRPRPSARAARRSASSALTIATPSLVERAIDGALLAHRRPRGRRRLRRARPRRSRRRTTSGRANAVIASSSPGRLIPISRTQKRCAGSSAKTTAGTPMRLFRFPAVKCVGATSARSAAVSSFVVVLPALPVIATTRPSADSSAPASRGARARGRPRRRACRRPRRRSRSSGRARARAAPALDDEDARAALRRAVEEGVAVVRLAAERDEDAAWRRPRGCRSTTPTRRLASDARPRRGDRRRRSRARPRRARSALGSSRDRRRHGSSPRVAGGVRSRRVDAASARRASTRSSKARFSVPTIW